MNGGDFDFDLPFRLSVYNAEEQNNLENFVNKTRHPPTRALTLLCEFAEAKIQRAVKGQALHALCEIHTVLGDLVRCGHTELEPQLRGIEAGFARCARAGLQQLLHRALDPATPPDRVQEITEVLVEIGESGRWPDFKSDLEAAVESFAPRAA